MPIAISAGAITNLTESIGDAVSSLLVAGTGIALSYNDPANTLTISATNTGTVTSVSASAPVSGFTISGSPITGSGTFIFTLNNDLLGLENISTLGFAARTATNTWTTRTITGTAANIAVANGDGIAGIPTINLIATAVTPNTYGSASVIPTFTVDSFGRITSASDVAISITPSQFVNFNEEVQDILGSAIVGGTNVTVVYNDLAGTITINANAATLTHTDITDFSEAVDDRVAALLVAGTDISLVYNDVANTLTINSTGGGGGVSGSGGPLQVPYWDVAGTTLISTSDFIFDGTNLGINTPSTAINSILTTKGISGGALSWGYSHLNSTDDIVFSVTDNGQIALGNASINPLTIGDFGMERAVGYYFSTASGNIQLIPTGIIHLASPVGINTTMVGSNKLKVSGATQLDLGGDATNDLLKRGASGSLVRIPIGVDGDVLTIISGNPVWAASGVAGLPAGTSGDLLVHNGSAYVSVSPLTETQTGVTGSTSSLASTPLAYTSFTLYRNGLYQVITDDFTRSGLTVTWVLPLVSTDKITAIYYI